MSEVLGHVTRIDDRVTERLGVGRCWQICLPLFSSGNPFWMKCFSLLLDFQSLAAEVPF